MGQKKPAVYTAKSGRLRRNCARLLIVKHNEHPIRLETLGRQFVRLNKHHLEQFVVLEMAKSGAELVCLSGSLDALKHVTDLDARP